MDWHILRALDLRTRRVIRYWRLGAHNFTFSIPGGDPRDYATTTRIRLLDEGVDQHVWIGNCGRRLFLPGGPGLLALHQPRVCLVCSAADIGLSGGIGQYHRLIDSSALFWPNQKCPQRRRRNWIASQPDANMNVSQRYYGRRRGCRRREMEKQCQ